MTSWRWIEGGGEKGRMGRGGRSGERRRGKGAVKKAPLTWLRGISRWAAAFVLRMFLLI